MIDKEFGCFKFLKLKYRKQDQIIKPFCKIGSLQEIRSPLFNVRKIKKIKKSTSESIGIHWGGINGKVSESFKFPELKYRRRDQIIHLFCRIDSPQKIMSPLFHLRKFQKIEKSTGE